MAIPVNIEDPINKRARFRQDLSLKKEQMVGNQNLQCWVK